MQKLKMASYEYGPEVLFLIFPPVKLGGEFHLKKPRNTYLGIDFSVNGLVAFWMQSGLYFGFKYKRFTIEDRLNYLYGENPDKMNTFKEFSHNPKIGIEYRGIYFKVGPYIPIKSLGKEKLNEDLYLKVGDLMMNLELGYRFDFNKKK
jgi:hypothetical protein